MVSSGSVVKPLRYRLVSGGTRGWCCKFLILPAQGNASKALQMATEVIKLLAEAAYVQAGSLAEDPAFFSTLSRPFFTRLSNPHWPAKPISFQMKRNNLEGNESMKAIKKQ